MGLRCATSFVQDAGRGKIRRRHLRGAWKTKTELFDSREIQLDETGGIDLNEGIFVKVGKV